MPKYSRESTWRDTQERIDRCLSCELEECVNCLSNGGRKNVKPRKRKAASDQKHEETVHELPEAAL